MEEKISGIVLTGVNYGESDKIINIFTPEKGVISAKMKSVKKAGAKLKFAYEPFCFAEFVFSLGKVGRTVIGASLIDSFYPLRLDIKKLYSASAILTFAKKFCKENIDSSDVFILALDGLKKIAYGDGNEGAYLLEFMCKALSVSGYALDMIDCCDRQKTEDEKIFFDYFTGRFYCEQCYNGGGREILNQTYRAIKSALNGNAMEKEGVIKGLKLIDFYIENKADLVIEPLKEVIKIYN